MTSTVELINIELNDVKDTNQFDDSNNQKQEELKLRLQLEEEDAAYFNSIYNNNNLNNFLTYL
jgi:hypothetical protein